MRYLFSSFFSLHLVQLLCFPTNLPQVLILFLRFRSPFFSLLYMVLLLLRPNQNKSKQYNKVNLPCLPILQNIPQIMIPLIHILNSMKRKPRQPQREIY